MVISVREDGSGNVAFGIGKIGSSTSTGYDYALNTTYLMTLKCDLPDRAGSPLLLSITA